MSVALITGGSAGLGLELVRALSAQGWTVITDGRDAERLHAATADLRSVIALPGDITDADHKEQLRQAVADQGRLDLLINNASALGPSPLRPLHTMTVEDLTSVWRPNVGAPLVLTSVLLPALKASGGVLVSISSDAAIEHYEGWGLYGASKAGLDHLTLTFGQESSLTAYAIDPGDMRTQMHQDAFPGEDISDRPLPETVVPHLLGLLAARPESGRYKAADFPAADLPATTLATQGA